MNTSSGVAGSIINALLSHSARKDGTKRRLEYLAEGEDRQRILTNAKRVTAGAMIKAGIYSCNNSLLLDAVQAKEEKKNIEQQAKQQKVEAKISLLRFQVKSTLAKRGPDPITWNKGECRAFLQYKKRRGDGKMPSSLDSLQILCRDWSQRPSPPPSPARENLC